MQKITARVTDINYMTKETSPIVQLTARGLDGGRYNVHVTGTEPYFFVPESATVPSCNEVEYVEEEYEGYDGQPLRKVVTRVPGDVGDIRDSFNATYEADVPYERRVSVDYGLSGYVKIPELKSRCDIEEVETDLDDLDGDGIVPRIMLCDIETEPPENTDNWDDYVEKSPGKVLMITTYDSFQNQYLCIALDEEEQIDPKEVREHLENHWGGHDDEKFYTQCDIRLRQCESESELFGAFINEVKNKRPDIASGWNFTDFDWPYLINRMNRKKAVFTVSSSDLSQLGMVKPWRDEDAVPGLPSFDMMDAFTNRMSYGEWRSKSLDYVSSEELDSSKVEGGSIMDQYEEERSKLMAYNLVDVQLLTGLDKKHGIHEFFYSLADLCGVKITDTQ